MIMFACCKPMSKYDTIRYLNALEGRAFHYIEEAVSRLSSFQRCDIPKLSWDEAEFKLNYLVFSGALKIEEAEVKELHVDPAVDSPTSEPASSQQRSMFFFLEKRHNDLKEIYYHFGAEAQFLKTVEELAELITELTRWNNIPAGEYHELQARIHEEIADVMVMLYQLSNFSLSISQTEISKHIEAKVNRTLKRIKDKERWN